NGKWNDDKKQVVWSSDLARDAELPTLCHAMWAVSEVSYQREHFGKVVLDGDNLQQFNLWHEGLTDQETKEWDRFVSNLRPDGRLKTRIQEFRFSNEPANKKKAKLSGVAKNLVLNGLSAESE
ncbi:MAG: hypothetical protein IH899_21230, partial [Planctomycetes bacterium]|nr:hypothetical protein [Planctomycetota bacterium]